MNLRPEQLSTHLQQGLKPVYLVSGDEPLLVQEACDEIRQQARQQGFGERTLYQVEGRFDWDQLYNASSALSLFAQRQIIEIRLPSGKPGDEGSKALQDYCQHLSDANLLLLVTPKLDKSTQNSKWFKALDQVGVSLQIWPIDRQHLPQWIARRMRQAGLEAEQDALQLLADLVDGNLLAAAQEIEKLAMQYPAEKVDCQRIRDAVCDSSRYNVFNLIDTSLQGNAAQTLKILSGLQAEGIEPASLIWALAREARQLAGMVRLMEQGQSAQQAMRQYHVWSSRQSITGQALARLTSRLMNQLLVRLAQADQTMKGMREGNVWEQLEQIALQLAGTRLAIR